mmetsp:Transcript_39484/g.39933  ORF Transcript_39484/g.39933 Transcript_39484/m.39933 type:complete len:182 (+) Transcript_39484:173-718(+)
MGWVAKPRCGREGMGIRYSDDDKSWQDCVKAGKNAASSNKISSSSNNTASGWLLCWRCVVPSASSTRIFVPVPATKVNSRCDNIATRTRDWGTEHSQEEALIQMVITLWELPFFNAITHPLFGRAKRSSRMRHEDHPWLACLVVASEKTGPQRPTMIRAYFVPPVTTRGGLFHASPQLVAE